MCSIRASHALHDIKPDRLSKQSAYYIKLKNSPALAFGQTEHNQRPRGLEVVTFNNRRLQRGVDYDIDYGTGTVSSRG
jgi:hypothetical protein